jgi:hypothetical protein
MSSYYARLNRNVLGKGHGLRPEDVINGAQTDARGNFEFQYKPLRCILRDNYVDWQRLVNNFDLAEIHFNMRRGGAY